MSRQKRIWVDTDFGFDDLWALLLLKHLNIDVDGISLVAGNVPLPQVLQNAEAAIHAFGFDWPVYVGAEKPLYREPETAERILGKSGMCSRGISLPYDGNSSDSVNKKVPAIEAIKDWLKESGRHTILALGPLTNLATLIQSNPAATEHIVQISWLGGSCGRGNHSEFAEYNALADPEAVDAVAQSQLPFKMIDLEICRQVSFGESDIPRMRGKNKQLLADLLGGYLDIALQRKRSAMSIYDPLAALSVINSHLFEFEPASLTVHTQTDAKYGQTNINFTEHKINTPFEIATSVQATTAKQVCLSALVDV